jgi:2-dehydro-3-deoxygluconokinase
MATVVGIGETLIRLTPPGGETLETTPTLTIHIGGAESNVCATLAQLGIRTAWISRLPATPLGRRVARTIQGYGVDVQNVLWAPGGNIGLMFVQPGADPRPGEVFYYRAGSAFSGIDPDAVAWSVLEGTRLLHLTGITPALGQGPRRLVERALQEAGRRGVQVSFDVNYRARLWTTDEARTVLEPLLLQAEVIFLSERDARAVFQATGEAPDAARALRERFRCGVLVMTRGADGALAVGPEGTSERPAVPSAIVDRIGRGDAFAAGFLYGYLRGSVDEGLRYGTALASLKQTYPGDICQVTHDDLEAILGGGAGGFRR